MFVICIGFCGSDFVLWQVNYVKCQLEQFGVEVIIIIIKMQGDKIQDIGFEKMEGKGFFMKEIEVVLLVNEIDLVVYFYKDFEMESLVGLIIVVVLEWEDLWDVLLIYFQGVDESQDY